MELHIVKQGECLSSIAAAYGFADWHTIYDDPANANFRRKRPDPNLIYPGDELNVPDLDPGNKNCSTEKRHVFVLSNKPTYFNVRIQTSAKQALAQAAYQLKLDTTTLEGSSDDDGWIKVEIPPLSELGTLTLWPEPADKDHQFQWNVKLGHLDPLETTTGVKARLSNLGYDCGEVNDQQDEFYDSAVRQFQQDNDLVVDGIVGPKTRGELKQAHLV